MSTTDGILKIFFGYAAGVGKTYAMLEEAQQQQKRGIDVLVGYIEPHTRVETLQLLEGLPLLPPKIIQYHNIKLKEFDLDAALEKKPQIILVDELAHSNAEGVRNKKRYQDVEELLHAGIDVYTTINVQHMESLNDVVSHITNVTVKETIPDYIFDKSDKVELIDIEPDKLLKRFEEGKIYRSDRVATAMNHFFSSNNLDGLREIAMRKAADRINREAIAKSSIEPRKVVATKLLVAISASPYSAHIIRATARMAEAFHSSWLAVYVETSDKRYFSQEQNKCIRDNMALAEQLGAEIVTLSGENIAFVIAEYAKLANVTNVVLGKSRNKRTLKNFFEEDFEDQIIAYGPELEVHMIPNQAVASSYKKTKSNRLKQNFNFSTIDTYKTLGVLALSTLICVFLSRMPTGRETIGMIYILGIVVVSRVTVGYWYGIIASFISVLGFNLFFGGAILDFNIMRWEYPITLVIMLLGALLTSALTIRIKVQAELAVSREGRTRTLYEINKKLLSTRGMENIVELTNHYIVKLFSRSVIFYTEDPMDGKEGALKAQAEEDVTYMESGEEKAVAHWVFVNQKRAGAGTDTFRGARAFYMPVISQGQVLGVLGIGCLAGDVLDQNTRIFLRMIASQVAMALERQHLSDKQRLMSVETEKEKMRSNLLRAISHDLRTPLTGILGASSVLLEEALISKEEQYKLLLDIKKDSQWLIRMVENLLSVTRIHTDTMNVTKVPEAAEEIVAEAISRVKKNFKNANIKVKVPDELLVIPMDGTLIEQVIINLLENAIKHSKENTLIEVCVRKEGKIALFEVSDNGEGIDKDEVPNLFKGYLTNEDKSSDASRGMGIGLSICMSIVKAHGGNMSAINKKQGGATFTFILPLERGINDGA